ncbi:MAG: hypothetical protein KDA90_10685 [Planctomycetaceae bacterium]|nr:hypothetical protein [Planctomycetaceae bacterium]
MLKLLPFVCCGMSLLLAGCGGGTSTPVAEQPASPAPASTVAESPASEMAGGPSTPAVPTIPSTQPMAIPTISLSGSSSNATPDTAGTGTSTARSASTTNGAAHRKEILEAMDPLQIMLGAWRGTTQKDFGDFKGLDQPNWVWDFKTDRNQPAMVMTSEASPYFKEARITYLTDRKVFQLVTTDTEGGKRTFEGTFSQAAEKFQGDDDRLHIKYKLELDQIDGTSPRDTWQVVLNQQHNNRYLVELARSQGSRFLRFDTVATQRAGTSFAKSDDDYGDKTCIISGGLGTISVSYKGKSYWVCCTGCKAAFEEDPETWLAEFEAKQKK